MKTSELKIAIYGFLFVTVLIVMILYILRSPNITSAKHKANSPTLKSIESYPHKLPEPLSLNLLPALNAENMKPTTPLNKIVYSIDGCLNSTGGYLIDSTTGKLVVVVDSSSDDNYNAAELHTGDNILSLKRLNNIAEFVPLVTHLRYRCQCGVGYKNFKQFPGKCIKDPCFPYTRHVHNLATGYSETDGKCNCGPSELTRLVNDHRGLCVPQQNYRPQGFHDGTTKKIYFHTPCWRIGDYVGSIHRFYPCSSIAVNNDYNLQHLKQSETVGGLGSREDSLVQHFMQQRVPGMSLHQLSYSVSAKLVPTKPSASNYQSFSFL